jgi:lipopolysaccharide transport system permease protein
MVQGAETRPPRHRIVLEQGRADRKYWSDLWSYRELFVILAWRDVAVQYRQTVVGVAWAIFRPLLTMLVFTAVFGDLARLPSEGDAPYSIMVMAGMLPWFLISTSLTNASNSLVLNSSLISKVYFPRLIVPVACSAVALIDFFVASVVLVGLMIFSGFAPGWQVAFLPLFLVLAIVASLGTGLTFAALNVRYRDFRIIIPFLMQLGLFASPVGFSSSLVPDQFRILYSLNPAVGVIDGFRWCLLGGEAAIYWPGFLVSCAVSLFLFWLGVKTFRATERTFADVI